MKYQETDLVRIAKRENNNKRKYLVVNPLQGKHIPVSPEKAFQMMDVLAQQIRLAYPKERLLLVGFAETATAIGARLAVKLETGFMQTTREKIPGVEYLYFTESHSHATEQKLVKDDLDANLGQFERIVFVEDEVTTGNTILKIVEIIRNVYPGNIQFSVACLLNGMEEEAQKRYQQQGIAIHYLVKTDHNSYTEQAEHCQGDGKYIAVAEDGQSITEASSIEEGTERLEKQQIKRIWLSKVQDIGIKIEEIWLSGYQNTRRYTEGRKYDAACEMLWQQIQGRFPLVQGRRCLVLGTEEFMYPALYVGAKLQKAGFDVCCHATTRSPIEVSRKEGYPLHERYELWSFYEEQRRTFVYDLTVYDQVLILCDATGQIKKGLDSLISALRLAGNKNIICYRWCEDEKLL